MANAAPESFGRYELVHRLAHGGMGEVFLARLKGPMGFEKLLVIKRILRQHAHKKSFIDMFFSEARVAAKLTHRNVVQIFDLGEIDGSFYLAMEHVRGKSLKDVIQRCRRRKSPLPLAHVVDIMQQVCEGMAYAHAATDARGPLNLVHRDINPRNILLSYNGEAKIIDFGIAKSRVQLEQTGAGVIKGKLAYMSPEQATARRIDKRSDIFSLGICLYELLTFQHPFWDDDRIMTFDRIQRQEPAPLGSFDARLTPLQQIIDRSLAKSPSERYPDCNAMRRDLQKVMVTGKVSLPDDSLSEYMHEIFADDIVADNELLQEVTRLAPRPAGLDEPAPAPEPVRPTVADWPLVTGRFAAMLDQLQLRARVVPPLLTIVAATAFGAVELHAAGRRAAQAALLATPVAKPMDEIRAPPPLDFVEPRDLSVPAAPSRAPAQALAPAPAPEPEVEMEDVADEDADDGRDAAEDVELESGSIVQLDGEGRLGAKTRPAAKAAKADKADKVDKTDKADAILVVQTEPTVRVVYKGKKVGNKVSLRGGRGRIQLGSGKDPRTDPFKVLITYSYTPGGKTVFYRLESEPWSIAQNDIGSGLGRTPVTVNATGRQVFKLRTPDQTRALSISLQLMPP